MRRFERLGELNDLNESILMCQEVVQLTPHGHPNKPSRLSNLGHALLTRFTRLEELSDLNESVLKKYASKLKIGTIGEKAKL